MRSRGSFSRSCRAVSMPLVPAIQISKNTTSYAPVVNRAKRSSPLENLVQIGPSPWNARRSSSSSRRASGS